MTALVLLCTVFGVAVAFAAGCEPSCTTPGQMVSFPQEIFSVAAPAPIAPLSGVCCDTFYPPELLGNAVVAPSPLLGSPPCNGPESAALPLIQAPAVTLPAVEGPVITLASPAIPAPRVLAQKCICTKTIVKPQVYQRTVVVPKVQRYLKRTVTPVVENVAYKSTPVPQAKAVGPAPAVMAAPVQTSSGCRC